MSCSDVDENDVKTLMQEVIDESYDCFQTSLGGPGITASVTDMRPQQPAS